MEVKTGKHRRGVFIAEAISQTRFLVRTIRTWVKEDFNGKSKAQRAVRFQLSEWNSNGIEESMHHIVEQKSHREFSRTRSLSNALTRLKIESQRH